jgi:hypothetical protein
VLAQIFERLDENDSGGITFDEFSAWVNDTPLSGRARKRALKHLSLRSRVFEDDDDYILKDVIQKNKPFVSYFMRKPRKIKPNALFTPNDIVYDLEEMREKGKQARQAMEQRALNLVLKRLVNETFEW